MTGARPDLVRDDAPERGRGHGLDVRPLPVGFRIELDPEARELRPGTWFGGQPAGVLRLTAAGQLAWSELRDGAAVRTRAAGLLARRLVDAGLAHPVPPPAADAPDVTVVVPVYGRPDSLARCLSALGRRFPVLVVDDASPDQLRVHRAAAVHGARVVRLDVNGGPGVARNAGLAHVQSEFVAFVDSDTLPGGEWIEAAVAQLADPLLAAVAPRIAPLSGGGWAGTYAAMRSSIDLGRRPGYARPYCRVSYVPSAALVARRSALLDVAVDGHVFDPALRVGEDVDLVWRLGAVGHRVRYEPASTVLHVEPRTWAGLLARRLRYGTSAAPLARRHPDSLAPFVVHPWFTATVGALLARRPLVAGAAFTATALSTRHKLHRAGVPADGILRPLAGGVAQTWLALGRYLRQLAAPLLVAGMVRGGSGGRVASASLLLGPALTAWRAGDRRLDLVRYTLAHLADDLAYGAGVYAGCLRHRTVRPLLPVLAHRRR